MSTTTLTALYDQRAEADRAAARLMGEAGVPRSEVEVIAQDTGAAASGAAAETGFVASLKNLFVPEDDRAGYSEAVRRGGFLLTAKVEQTAAEQAMDILEEQGAIDLDERQRAWRAEGWTGEQATPTALTRPDGSTVAIAAAEAAPAMTATAAAREAPSPRAGRADAEERIDIVEEQMRIGKRLAAGGRVRVRSYVVETPVEEKVTLRDEHISVERRTVDRAPTPADEVLFAERTIEATETDEEAVVSKTAHVTGEVVVSKTAEERVETVRDTVRRTEVEVEDERVTTGDVPAEPAAGLQPAASKTSGPRR